MGSIIALWPRYGQLILSSIGRHAVITLTAECMGILLALPLGILLSYHPKAAKGVLAVFGVINTIPSLALLGVAMVALGLGFAPAVVVLFLYSILPILRNTYTGITEVAPKYIRAAKGMGMSKMQILWNVQLPLALPVTLAGVRISTVYVVSWGTLAAFIGAGGLGDPIWMGMQSYNFPLVFAGAIPTTLMALFFSFALGRIQRMAARRSTREESAGPKAPALPNGKGVGV